jgi:hypothetical protein
MDHLPFALLDRDDAAAPPVCDPPNRLGRWWTYRVAHRGRTESVALRAMTAGAWRHVLVRMRTRKPENDDDYPVQIT